MASDKPLVHLFNYGSTVSVCEDAPPQYRKITVGSVCGMRILDDDVAAESLEEDIGTLVYIVEDSCGNSSEIPERYLKRLT